MERSGHTCRVAADGQQAVNAFLESTDWDCILMIMIFDSVYLVYVCVCWCVRLCVCVYVLVEFCGHTLRGSRRAAGGV